MGAAAIVIGEQHLERCSPLLLLGFLLVGLHQPDVVGVSQPEITLAAVDALGLCAVIAFGLAGEVITQTGKPGFSRCFAQFIDHRGEKREVIAVLARAGADPALPFRVGQFFVSDAVLLDPVDRCVNDAAALGQGEPVIVLIAEGRRDVRCDCRRGDRLGHALVDEIKQPADVGGQQHVSRGTCPLCHEAIHQPLLDEQNPGIDPGFSGESVEHGLDQIGLAGGVDVDGVRLARDGECDGKKGRSGDKSSNERTRCHSLWVPGSGLWRGDGDPWPAPDKAAGQRSQPSHYPPTDSGSRISSTALVLFISLWPSRAPATGSNPLPRRSKSRPGTGLSPATRQRTASRKTAMSEC